jgi:hypothetical protein
MIFRSSFRWRTWLLSFLPVPIVLFVGVVLVSMLATPRLWLQKSILIETSPEEVWAFVSNPPNFLEIFPLGDGLWLPTTKELGTAEIISSTDRQWTLRFDEQILLHYLLFPEKLRVRLVTTVAPSPKADAEYLWLRMIEITSLDQNYVRITVTTQGYARTVLQKIMKVMFSESYLNLLYENFLFQLKERLEQKRRS